MLLDEGGDLLNTIAFSAYSVAVKRLLKLAPCLCLTHCIASQNSADEASPAHKDTATDGDTHSDTGSSPQWLNLSLTPVEDCTSEHTGFRRWTDEAWSSQQVDERADFPPTTGWGVAVADFDGNGFDDIFLTQIGVSEFFFNQGGGTFERAPDSSYPWPFGTGLAATAVDIEGDGDFDIVETGFGQLRLLVNDGTGQFSAGTMPEVNPTTRYFGSAWADMDNDGDLDGIVVAFPTPAPTMEERETEEFIPGAPDLLIENTDAGLVDRSELLPDTNNGHTFLSSWQDIDGDQRPELVVMNDYLNVGQTNRVWRMVDGQFEDISAELILDAAMESMGLGIADINSDGRPDFLVSGWSELGLFESDPAAQAWVRTGVSRGLEPTEPDRSRVGWAVEFADLNHNTQEEAMVAFGHWELFDQEGDPLNPLDQPDSLFTFQDGQAADEAAAWGFAEETAGRAMTFADLDLDGHIDVIRRPVYSAGTIDSAPCSQAGSVTVRLTQPGQNPHGIGSMVTILIGEQQQTRWIRAGGTGLASGGPPMAHFGLGGAATIDQLTVAWPDGETSTWSSIPTNHHLKASRD